MAERTVKTTQIVKKWTDKKTGEKREITIDYSKVNDRLKQFWEDHPNGKVATDYKVSPNGLVIFKSWIWKDKLDYMKMIADVKDLEVARETADANGTAQSVDATGKGEKEFEKLETISLGRALAILGYFGTGEIASNEEMEEFERYKKLQREEKIQDAVISLQSAQSLDELRRAFFETRMMEEPDVVAAKDKRKAELSKEQSNAMDTPHTDAGTKSDTTTPGSN